MAFMAAALPVILAVGGEVVKGVSNFQQAKYQAAVAKNNAKIAAQNAERADYANQIDQMRSDRDYRSQEATLLATQAASGLDVLGASQIGSRLNLERIREEQAVDIRMKGLYEIRNFQQEQANFLGEKRALNTQAWMGVAATAFDIGGTIYSNKGALGLGGSSSTKSSLIGGTGQ